MPGYGIKNYADFFAGSNVMKGADVNPHSFVVEIILAFGICGLAFLITIAGIITRTYRLAKQNSNESIFLLVTAVIFVVATNVPSSVFRLPLLWFPLFFQIFVANEQRFKGLYRIE
jgi:O-antigen ligase